MPALDDDILADFLTEAGELVQELGEQVVALEQAPGDAQLMNAVFRAFHTIKGGAGFLELTPIVRLCHAAEDLCNAVRGGKLAMNASMMDQISQSVDVVQAQLDAVREGHAAPAAPESLIQGLVASLAADTAPPATESAAGDVAEPAPAKAPAEDAPAPAADGAAATGIDDDEFEALLDQLHGGAAPGQAAAAAAKPPAESSPPDPAPAPAPAPAASGSGPAKAPAPAADPTVRVDIRRLDSVLNLVGELVLIRNRMKLLRERIDDEDGEHSIGELDQITGRLQMAVMKIRMQPIRKVFARFPKLVRDLARTLGKEIRVELHGEETELDKNLVEALADPLVHMVRNAVDHGIEAPELREAAGKPRQGTLELRARQEGDSISITIRDDGGGIDPNALRAKAIDKGILGREEAARMDARECFQIMFMPGFSTRDQVSDVSGRGVGMDVVKTRINELNGLVEIDSEIGVGSSFEIRVPLTLAILPTLMVSAGGRVFAVPLSAVSDVIVLDPKAERTVDRREMLVVRGEVIPLLSLKRWVEGPQADHTGEQHVVIARAGTEIFGVVVDAVRGREEVVIKPLGAMLQSLAGFAGATVTGDGQVALILDMSGLLKVLGPRPK